MLTDSNSVISLKVLFIGPKKVGKSSYAEKIISGLFTGQYKPTYGHNFLNYSPDIVKGKDLSCHIVDMGGKMLKAPRYMKISLYKANIAIIFFDISNFDQTFPRVKKYAAFLTKNKNNNGLGQDKPM